MMSSKIICDLFEKRNFKINANRINMDIRKLG